MRKKKLNLNLNLLKSANLVRMSDVEILGKPLYRSRKLQDEEQNSSTQQESKKRLSDPDLQYQRDEKDWWWCDDV
jgi:hypothetical protein